MKDRIKKLCKEKGVSMNLAESEIGLAKGYISKLNNSNPNINTLRKIACYFDVSVEYLLNGEETEGGEKYYLNDETAEIAQEIFENKDLKMLFDVTKNVSPQRLKAYYKMIKELEKQEKYEGD